MMFPGVHFVVRGLLPEEGVAMVDPSLCGELGIALTGERGKEGIRGSVDL